MDFFLKQLPDNTVTLVTQQGWIIGKFDSPEEAEDIILEAHLHTDDETHATEAWRGRQ